MELARIFELGELAGLGLALAIGLLVGLQRGWAQRDAAAGSRFAGVRTFGLFGLAGGVAGWLFADARELSTVILGATAGLILISYHQVARSGGSISGTSSLTGLLTLACGFLATHGAPLDAIAIGASMVALLAMRPQLHRLVGRMSEDEIAAIARFALIAFVILPLLPDRGLGPYAAWNPRQLWFVVVLVSGFSLAGYVATRLLGPERGALATAAAGAVVSSTAVTAAVATQLRDGSGSPPVHAGAIATASVVMFLRVMVLAGLLAPFALRVLVQLTIPGLVVSAVFAGWFMLNDRRAHQEADNPVLIRNPFSLGPALLLMALVMVMTLAARWVLARYGDAGLAVVLAISGSIDVDSAIITMGSLPPGTLTPRVGGLVLLAPVVINSLFKAATAVGIAGWAKGWRSALALVLSALACLAAVPFA